MNKDRLYSAHPKAVMQAAYTWLSALQDEPPEMQVAGVAMLFREMVRNTGISYHELMVYADRVGKDSDLYYQSQLRALREYVDKELN